MRTDIRVSRLIETPVKYMVFVIGSSTCPAMFQSGRWRGSFWQPRGCMMHSYTSRYAGKFTDQKS